MTTHPQLLEVSYHETQARVNLRVVAVPRQQAEHLPRVEPVPLRVHPHPDRGHQLAKRLFFVSCLTVHIQPVGVIGV